MTLNKYKNLKPGDLIVVGHNARYPKLVGEYCTVISPEVYDGYSYTHMKILNSKNQQCEVYFYHDEINLI